MSKFEFLYQTVGRNRSARYVNRKGSLFWFWRDSPQWARATSFTRFLDHTQRRTTVGSTPLDEWSARRRDLYITIHNTHNRQTSMLPVGFEPTISAGERPQTYAVDRAATNYFHVFLRNSGWTCERKTILKQRSSSSKRHWKRTKRIPVGNVTF